MRRLLIPSLALLVICGAVAQPALASSSAAGLLHPYDVTWLEDQDWEMIVIDVDDTDGLLDSNDYLVGMFEVTKGTNKTGVGQFLSSATLNAYTGVFVLQYNGTTVTGLEGGGATYYSFSPVANWSTLPGGLGLSDPVNNGKTIAAVYDNSHFGEGAAGGVFVDPTGGIAAALDTATRDTLAYEFGFMGLPGEFWLSSSIAGVPPLSLQFYGSLNVTYSNPSSPVLLPHNWYYNNDLGQLLDPGDLVLGPKITQVHLQGGITGIPTAGDFDIITDTDFYVYATPEPGSLILLGLGLAACGGVVYRRRRNK
jgi:hypothetical protein